MTRLLGETDPHPVAQRAATASSPFVLVSDHAGRAMPASFGDMGISEVDRARHIAWDIGMKEVANHLQLALGCDLIEQVYSRLVIDCNRAPSHPTSVPPVSDGTPIAANIDLAEHCRTRREIEILHPYHERIASILDARGEQPTALIALHSFTPRMDGFDRPWQIGLLHNRDRRLSDAMFAELAQEGDLCVGDNEPYVLTDTSDYTVPTHAEARGLPYLEIEIRQDLVAHSLGQVAWAQRLARLLPAAWIRFQAAYHA